MQDKCSDYCHLALRTVGRWTAAFPDRSTGYEQDWTPAGLSHRAHSTCKHQMLLPPARCRETVRGPGQSATSIKALDSEMALCDPDNYSPGHYTNPSQRTEAEDLEMLYRVSSYTLNKNAGQETAERQRRSGLCSPPPCASSSNTPLETSCWNVNGPLKSCEAWVWRHQWPLWEQKVGGMLRWAAH